MADMTTAAKTYQLGYGKSLSGMACALQAFFAGEWQLETQSAALDSSEWLIQGRFRKRYLRRFLGLERALTVRLEDRGADRMSVEAGCACWLDLAGVPPAFVLVLRPLGEGCGLGIRQPEQLVREIEREVSRYLR